VCLTCHSLIGGGWGKHSSCQKRKEKLAFVTSRKHMTAMAVTPCFIREKKRVRRRRKT
jgi:hypothetical protein